MFRRRHQLRSEGIRCSVVIMEKYLLVFFLQAVILAVNFQSGLSIKCYLCNSKINPNCGDPADKMNMEAKECSPTIFQEGVNKAEQGFSALGKALNMDIPEGQIGKHAKFTCQKIKVSGKDGDSMVMRSCTVSSSVSGDPCTQGIEKLAGDNAKIEYCGTCEDDYCNASNRHTSKALLFLLVPCFAVIASRWISI